MLTRLMMLIGAIVLFLLSMVLVMVADPMYSLVTLLLFVVCLTALFIDIVER